MKGLKIPERFTGTVYVCIWSNPEFCLYGDIFLTDYHSEGQTEQILLGQIEIDIPLEFTGSLDKQVKQLMASKRRIIAEATEKAGQIDEAIESLLAIEYQGEAK